LRSGRRGFDSKRVFEIFEGDFAVPKDLGEQAPPDDFCAVIWNNSATPVCMLQKEMLTS
jgi:hypothetical protein